ncbi:MAG: hypothetical protein K8H86_12610, partial [Ignavibacteriaceae bacterium]|nr:hypothetical protein [Ignavibacteriaceae bacterium]
MKKKYNEEEILSAYIDGELSQIEEAALEKKIALSKKLQEKFEELKRLKMLTQKAYKSIPESLYFETKVMAQINESKPVIGRLKKWSPVIAVAFGTLILMVFLRINPQLLDNIVDEQKDNIVGFYKENLQPLLFASNLSAEDVFNFALNRRLPLDQGKNHFLLLGSETDGDEYFEIKPAKEVVMEGDYENFVKALKLNQTQKLQMDSILGSYRDELETQVLSNDKNTIAINSNLWNYSKAIVADLMLFAKDANQSEFAKIIPAGYNFNDTKNVVQVVNRVRTMPDDNYIFFSPDTIFKSGIDKAQLKQKLREYKEQQRQEMLSLKKDVNSLRVEVKKLPELNFRLFIDQNKSSQRLRKNHSQNYNISVDSNVCRVVIPDIELPDFEMPDMKEIEFEIEQATKNLKNFSISFDNSKGKNSFGFKISTGDSTKDFNFVVPMPNVDS